MTHDSQTASGTTGDAVTQPTAGETTEVAIDALVSRDDDPRYVSARARQALAEVIQAGGPVPAISAYQDADDPAVFVAVEGAPYLPALRDAAVDRLTVTLMAYSEAEVLAHFVSGETTVKLSKVERARAVKTLIGAHADYDNPLAAAAKKTTVKEAQLRNLETLAAVDRRHGRETALAFPLDAAPRLRDECDPAACTRDDLERAKTGNNHQKEINAAKRLLEKDPAELAVVLAAAAERASDNASAAVTEVLQKVLQNFENGVSPGMLLQVLADAAGQDPETTAPEDKAAAGSARPAAASTSSAASTPSSAATGTAEAAEAAGAAAQQVDQASKTEPAAADGDGGAPEETPATETTRQALPTRRNRRKGRRRRQVLNRRRFIETATGEVADPQKRIPSRLQTKALELVNKRARELGLVDAGEKYLRRERPYLMETGEETGGTIELAVIVDVCQTAAPLLDSRDGAQMASAVREEMQRFGLWVPGDLDAVCRAQGSDGEAGAGNTEDPGQPDNGGS